MLVKDSVEKAQEDLQELCLMNVYCLLVFSLFLGF